MHQISTKSEVFKALEFLVNELSNKKSRNLNINELNIIDKIIEMTKSLLEMIQSDNNDAARRQILGISRISGDAKVFKDIDMIDVIERTMDNLYLYLK